MLDRQVSLRMGVAAVVVSLLGLGGLVAFLLGGENGPPSASGGAPAPTGTVPAAALSDYVGDQACAPCHPRIAWAHRHSRHAITLHPMIPGHLPASLPDRARFVDPATGFAYSLQGHQGRYFFTVVTADESRSQMADFAFGSGKTGITLVGRTEGGTLREFRMSYFPFRHRWEITPGQRGSAVDPLGLVHDPAVSQRCFTCHSTVIAASQAIPESRFLGVGCEACHGPGRRHIEALQRGDPTPHIENPGRWNGPRVNELCGRCHRSAQELDPLDTFSLSQTQRFQPLGLARSACFRRSAGRLSCVTCHDAHENARLDSAHYEAVCLSCHSVTGVQAFGRSGVQDRQGMSTSASASTNLDAQDHRFAAVPPERLNARTPERLNTVCPVNRRSGCIGCHMPNREVVRGISMADHWIRVFRSPAAEARRP